MKMPKSPPDFSVKIKEIADSGRLMDVLSLRVDGMTGVSGYYHWDELIYRDPPDGLTHDEWWVAMKLRRHAQRRDTIIPFDEKTNFWWTLPDLLVKRLHEIDVQSGITVRPDAKEIVRDTTVEYLRENSALLESVTSSQLEGAPTTWSDAKQMIRSGRNPRDLGERMILNNYRAMQSIVERFNQPLTQEYIRELHRILTSGTLEKADAEGRYRRADENIRVADDETVFHTPPPASRIPADMEALCSFANGGCESSDGAYMPDIVRAIILHFWLGYEHPFCDGNGRVARALMYWLLLRSGYSIFEYVSISNILKKAPSKYVRAYVHTETDEGDLTYFLLHQTEVVLRALEEFKTYIGRKEKKIRDTENLLNGYDITSRQRIVLAYAMNHRGTPIRIADCQRLCGISYATARTDIIALQEAGFFEMRKEGNAFVYYLRVHGKV